jgi:tetratricopeptide (TPR) repeat protein
MKRFAARKPVFAPSPQALAERGANALRQGQFKDATEIFKQLSREDPRAEWTQRLGDAYAGRARALAEKGMYKEAAIVLENTLVADGTIREPLLYVSCLVRQNQPQKARRAALDAMARLSPAETARLAEFAAALSLAAPSPGGADATPEGGEAWAAQNRAAQAALRAWLGGEPEDVVDRLLGGIPLRSPFGAMRLILKSLITPQDAAKVRALLAMVPAGSIFAGVRDAAEAARADDQDLLGQWATLRPAQQQFAAEMRGLPRDRLGLLNQILDAERRGPGALLSLLTRRGLPLPEDELRAACLNLLPAAPDRVVQFTQRFGQLSEIESNRVAALAAEAMQEWLAAMHYWGATATLLEHQATAESRLGQAVVLRHLADLARSHPDIADDLDEPGDGADPVAHFLERSLQADPTDLTAAVALLDRHRSLDDSKSWYREADLAVERFPGNPAVLLHAVDAAVSRNAFKKASGFARQLLAVDPINMPVRQRMIELQLAHARKQIRSGRPDLAAKSLDEASEWERPDMPNPALRIGRALVATMAATDGDAGAAEKVRAAVAEAGGGTLGWFRMVLEASLMDWPAKRLQLFQRELNAAQKSEPDRATVLALVGLLGQREVRGSRRAIAPAVRVFEPFLARGSQIDWSPAEFLTIGEMLAHLRNFRTLHRYAMRAVERDPGNLTARFYQVLARAEGKREALTSWQESELFSLMEQAAERQDFTLFNRVQKLVFGPGERKAIGRMLETGEVPGEQLDDEDMGALLASLVGEMPGLPAREVRDMVNQLGREAAIKTMAAMLSEGMSDVLSEEQVLQLCAALVAQALDKRSRPARRR